MDAPELSLTKPFRFSFNPLKVVFTGALIASLLLTASSLVAQETTHTKAPISGDDITRILELNVNKEAVSFGKPKQVTLRVESAGSSKDFALGEPTANVTLLTFIPAGERQIKELHFRLTAESGTALQSYVAIDTSKAKFIRSGVIKGIYTVTASDTEEMKAPVYRLQILTSDIKPQE